MLVIYLLQCFFCRTVQFKFHDIDEFVCLKDKVDAPFACMIFHFGIEADQFKDNEKHILVMQFLIANHFVGGICKETLQTTEERTVIAGTYFTNKFLNFKRRFYLIYIRIIRKQETDKSFFYFTIR